jgi:hypothetical protein
MRNLTCIPTHDVKIMSSQRNSSDSLAYVLIPAGIVAGFALSVSRTLGADFFTTAHTLLKLVAALALVGGLHYFLRPSASISIALFFVIAWPVCWALLESIASGGKAAAAIYDYHLTSWYVQSWFFYGIEVLFLGLFLYFIYKSLQEY